MYRFTLLLGMICCSYFQQLHAQDLLMQGWYWDYPKTANGHNWAQTLTSQAQDVKSLGVTQLWLPPLSRASFGSGSNGYDPKDLYDLGEYGGGATGFGTRADLDNLIAAYNGVSIVADVVYNHRDGGEAENNPAVKGWIENYDCTDVNDGNNVFPSDRFQCTFPIGGNTGHGAGKYFIQIRSASKHPNFHGAGYKVYMETSRVGWQNLPALNETSNNNGGGCNNAGSDVIELGRDMLATLDGDANCVNDCARDEFLLELDADDFRNSGDTIYIYLRNTGGYADQYIAGIYKLGDGTNYASQVQYQTYTNFMNMPSGRGGMDYTFFKPNGNPTDLGGDWDGMFFFYDYDQFKQPLQDTLIEWTKWLINDVGIDGLRMDAVKHFTPDFVSKLMNSLSDDGVNLSMAVGEWFDSNAGILNGWVNDVNAGVTGNKKAQVFDFAMRDVLRTACDFNSSGWDVRNIFQSGIVNGVGGSAFNTVTFVNNHDFRGPGEPIQKDPMLAYAYILTNNSIGLPTVFYPDVFPVTPPNYPATNLYDEIQALWAIHGAHIAEANNVEYLNAFGTPYWSNIVGADVNGDYLLYQISGGPSGEEVFVAINFSFNDDLKVDHEVTNLPEGRFLIEQTGNSPFPYGIVERVSDNDNRLRSYFEVPARSYAVWVSSNVAPLPVELLTFEATAKEKVVQLDWSSAIEEHFDFYNVERSLDGRTFESIGKVSGKGNNSVYIFEDANPVFNQPLYYRLAMTDLDGSIDHSKVRTARIETGVTDLEIRPNPVQDELTIQGHLTTAGTIDFQLINAQGQLIKKQTVEASDRFTQKWLMDALPAGTYWLKIKTASGTRTERVMKL